jgi:hypothetical protein
MRGLRSGHCYDRGILRSLDDGSMAMVAARGTIGVIGTGALFAAVCAAVRPRGGEA